MLIYLLNESNTWSYKIGYTKAKTPKNRVKSLQTGNKNKIDVVWTYESPFAHQIELMLHRNYGWCRGEGEWFLFEEVNLQEIKDKVLFFENILKELENEKSSDRY